MCESLPVLCPVVPPSPLVFMVSPHMGFSALELCPGDFLAGDAMSPHLQREISSGFSSRADCGLLY